MNFSIITPRRTCAARGQVIALGLYIYIYIYLLHESEWRYFTSRQPYFHEPQASENIA